MSEKKQILIVVLIVIVGLFALAERNSQKEIQKTIDAEPPKLTGQGFEAILTYGEETKVYIAGEQVTYKEWQEILNKYHLDDLEIDGKLGYETIQRAEVTNFLLSE